jgi:hypothetical protein
MQISVLKMVLAPSIVVAFNLVWILAARADPGVFDDRIVFGQSAALKGPAAALGLGMRDGIVAAFQESNATGGVHGRKLDLISYNDGYEPEMAIANTKRLIGEDKERLRPSSRLRRSKVSPLSGHSQAPPSYAIHL